MPEQQTDRQAGDVLQVWRDWLTQSERQFNAYFNDVMGTENFARALGSYMEVYALFQRMVAQGMERYLQFMNLPSRNDVTTLADAIRALDERMARMEAKLETAAGGRNPASEEAVSAQTAPAPPRPVRRTRRPPRRAQA